MIEQVTDCWTVGNSRRLGKEPDSLNYTWKAPSTSQPLWGVFLGTALFRRPVRDCVYFDGGQVKTTISLGHMLDAGSHVLGYGIKAGR